MIIVMIYILISLFAAITLTQFYRKYTVIESWYELPITFVVYLIAWPAVIVYLLKERIFKK